MDQHPIPQDVTGFQFKLIGTMTVKQFGYVASGVIMAVILYYIPIHSPIGVLVKVLLIPLFGISGVVIAFVPLEGRPIDVMATNFAKALFSPNQYIYHRQGRKLSFSTITVAKVQVSKKTDAKNAKNHTPNHAEINDEKGEKLRALLLSSHDEAKSDLDKKEAAFLNTLSLPSIQTSSSSKTAPAKHIVSAVLPPANTSALTPSLIQPLAKPAIQVLPPPTQIKNQPQEQKKSDSMQTSMPIKQEPPANQTSIPQDGPEKKATVLSQQINEVHAQKQKLEQELTHLKTQLATQKAVPAPTVNTPPQQPLQDPLHVRSVPQNVTKKVGLPHVSDSPNVVVGIVKDPRGNVLPNILVEVKDKDGNPVRAFKTNQLGQFASATPLSPGTYTIELDDPKKQHRFDLIQIVANNQVLLPIEVISHDAREELRKQLFAN